MCRGQAYDGASDMNGVRNGVQALVKREASCAGMSTALRTV